jgi:molecular chaperone GrpE (heat shock protein)
VQAGVLVGVLLGANAWGQPADERYKPLEDRLRAAGYSSEKGRVHWRLALSTGHFGVDPTLAAAMREEALSLLGRFGSEGDKVSVAAFEMEVWNRKGPIQLKAPGWEAAVEGLLPDTPKAGSRGGRDVYRALRELADRASDPSVILAITPGPSQLPKDGRGELLTETALPKQGYTDPFHFSVDAIGAPGRRLRITALLPENLAIGNEPRKPLPHAAAAAPSPKSKPAESAGGLPLWVAALAALLGASASWIVASRRARPLPAAAPAPQADPEPEPAPAEPAEETTPRGLIHTLDAISQDLAETVNHHAEAIAALKANVLEVGALRQEVARKESEVEAWIDGAIEFLDAAHRASTMEGVSPERRETWAKAAQMLARRCARLGLDVIDPKPGEPVVAGLHLIEEYAPGEPGIIQECLEWGFRTGSRVIRPAKVAAGKPEN